MGCRITALLLNRARSGSDRDDANILDGRGHIKDKKTRFQELYPLHKSEISTEDEKIPTLLLQASNLRVRIE